MDVAARVAERLAGLPGVASVVLGGARAAGPQHATSGWSLGVYHRGPLDATVPAALAELDPAGVVTQPGEWGRLMDGGAWLLVDDTRVDVRYRDLDTVEHWIAEAVEGRFEIDGVPGHLAGMPTYALAGEAALGRVLAGDPDGVPRPEVPPALAEHAPEAWRFRRSFSLATAEAHAGRRDVSTAAGMMARAAIEEAHARCCERREWVVDEEGLLGRAGLEAADFVLANLSMDRSGLAVAAAELRAILNPTGEQPSGLPA